MARDPPRPSPDRRARSKQDLGLFPSCPGTFLGPWPVADHVSLVQSAELSADRIDDLLTVGFGDAYLGRHGPDTVRPGALPFEHEHRTALRRESR